MAEVTRSGLARSTLFGLVAEAWRIGSRFFLTPLIIATIGIEGYGTWTLIFSITAQLAIVDASFGAAYSKLTAELDSNGRHDELSEVLGSGVALVGGFAMLVAVALWWGRTPLLSVLGAPPESLDVSADALAIVAMVVLARLSVGCVHRALEGLQRLDLVYKLDVGASILEFVVAITLLLAGWGVVGLAAGFAAGQLAATAVARWLCHRIEPRIRISPLLATRRGVKRIAGLGGKFQLLSVVGTFFNQGTKMLVSVLFGVGVLGVYEIANKLLTLGATIGRAIVGPLMPAFANLHARVDDAGRALALYARSSRVLALTTGTCFAFLVVFADDAVLMWTGEAYPLAVWTLRVSALGAFLHSLTGVATASLRARGTLRLEMIYAFSGMSLAIGVAVPAYSEWGYQGLVLAFAVSGSVVPIWLLSAYAKLEGLDFRDYAKTTVGAAFRVLAGPTLVVIGLRLAMHLPEITKRARFQALFDLAAFGLVFVVLAGVGAWFLALSRGERAAVGKHARSLVARPT